MEDLVSWGSVFGFLCYFWVAILEDGFPGVLYGLPAYNTGYVGSIQGFPGGSNGEECTYNVGDLGSISGLGRSLGGGPGNPLYYSCLENPHGQRNMAGYSPWSCQQFNMTEQLSTAQDQFLGQEDSLEKEMAIHPSVLAWEISRTEEPGGLQFTGLQKSQTWLSN